MMMCLMTPSFADIRKDASSQLLTRAIEYFQSGKYHEALLLFQRLDNKYKLNARFQGYIGVCYFYDGDYKKWPYWARFRPIYSCLPLRKGPCTCIAWPRATSDWGIIARRYPCLRATYCCATTTRRATP